MRSNDPHISRAKLAPLNSQHASTLVEFPLVGVLVTVPIMRNITPVGRPQHLLTGVALAEKRTVCLSMLFNQHYPIWMLDNTSRFFFDHHLQGPRAPEVFRGDLGRSSASTALENTNCHWQGLHSRRLGHFN